MTHNTLFFFIVMLLHERFQKSHKVDMELYGFTFLGK